MLAVGSRCRLVIADRGLERSALVDDLALAGWPVQSCGREKLGRLGLLEMDVLLELDAHQRSLAAFFPVACQLRSWTVFVSVLEGDGQPGLVLVRKVARGGTAPARRANQELVAMLTKVLPHAPEPAYSSVSSWAPAPGDTLVDAALPLAEAPSASALTRLVSEVAHDLNNLVTVIKGNCQLLLHEAAMPPTLRTAIQEINQVGEQAAYLAGHLTTEARREQPRAQVRDVRQLLEDSAGLLRGLLDSRHQLLLRLDERPCPARLIAGQLERILVNLTVNARDAMPDGGTLTIATESFETATPLPAARGKVTGPYVVITVSDTGTGLADEVRHRLFEPQPSTKAGGRGIGLTIVANLLRQNQGHIDVHSQAGAGTSFQLFFPRAPASEVEVMDTPLATPPNPQTILLVEDQTLVRSIFRRILQDNGFFVLDAANGAEALLLAQQFPRPIQLLVSDLSMPKMNGMELAARLAPLHPETRVLFLSGYTEGMLPGEQAPDKSIAFLQKPFKADTLLDKVHEVLR